MQSLFIKQSIFLFIPLSFCHWQTSLSHSQICSTLQGRFTYPFLQRKGTEASKEGKQVWLELTILPVQSVRQRQRPPWPKQCLAETSPGVLELMPPDPKQEQQQRAGTRGISFCSIRLGETITSFRLGKPYFSPSSSLNPTYTTCHQGKYSMGQWIKICKQKIRVRVKKSTS